MIGFFFAVANRQVFLVVSPPVDFVGRFFISMDEFCGLVSKRYEFDSAPMRVQAPHLRLGL